MPMFRIIIHLILIVGTFWSLNLISIESKKDNEKIPVHVSSYHYPIYDPLVSTITTAIIKPSLRSHYKEILFTLFPNRSKIRYFGAHTQLHLAFFKQNKNPTAPLIFLIPGVGGHALYPNTIYVAEILHKAGFNVLTLPASMSWQFALSVSKTGYPGYSPRDAVDMFELMKLVNAKLISEEKVKPKKYGLMGYSLGGLDAGFVSQLDIKSPYFNFERILMINPPLQKAKSIDSIDDLMISDSSFSIEGQIENLKRNQQKLFNFGQHTIESLHTLDLEKQIGLADSQLSWLIGADFKNALRDVLLVSQNIDDMHILKTPSYDYLDPIRETEAWLFQFKEYVEDVLFVHMTQKESKKLLIKSPADLIEKSDLRGVLFQLTEANKMWAVFHNENDFIFHRGDLAFLMKSHSASRIYPLGGHLGNLWYEQNQKDIINFFKPLLN